jgi:hypothetical protein
VGEKERKLKELPNWGPYLEGNAQSLIFNMDEVTEKRNAKEIPIYWNVFCTK